VSQAQEAEKTYSISLTKTAGIEEDIYEVDNKKVLTEEYTIKEGEWVWQILRQKGLLEHRNLSEILSVLQALNASLGSLDLVHPGEKIIIPLKIAPVAGTSVIASSPPPVKVSLADLKDVDLENYTVEPGDSLTRIIKGRYDIPKDYLYGEYLGMIKKLNPSIRDLNIIHPGQKIKLPVYSPEVVRKPIKMAMPQESEEKKEYVKEDKTESSVSDDLGVIFTEMGEEWVKTGEHFIPLKSGSQIDLKAVSFPILNLQNGLRVMVDLNNKLPDKMAKLIESSWGNYRVLHLVEGDNLRSALDKILEVCNYPKVSKMGEALELGGDIPIRITADWIVKLSEKQSNNRPEFVAINLNEDPVTNTPWMIKEYLNSLGVKVIDYPQGGDKGTEVVENAATLKGGGEPASLVRALLDLTGRSYSTDVEIPVYQKQKADFKLIIKADFFLKIKGRDAIIDLIGLAPEMISLLEDHKFSVLSMANEKDPLAMVSMTLEFLDIEFQNGPHSFMAGNRDDSKNVKLTLPGVVFHDSRGNPVLATPLILPEEIAAFLSKRAYKILPLSFP
jgi:LysM repeat protein